MTLILFYRLSLRRIPPKKPSGQYTKRDRFDLCKTSTSVLARPSGRSSLNYFSWFISEIASGPIAGRSQGRLKGSFLEVSVAILKNSVVTRVPALREGRGLAMTGGRVSSNYPAAGGRSTAVGATVLSCVRSRISISTIERSRPYFSRESCLSASAIRASPFTKLGILMLNGRVP